MRLNEIARRFIGQMEVGQNDGFKDPAFLALMLRTGWRKGLYWCAFFVKACVITAMDEGIRFVDLISPSAVQTWNFFRKAGRTYQGIPTPGDLAVWQHYDAGRPTSQGHIGIVEDPQPVVGATVNVFHCIEGNGSVAGSRNGDRVALKERRIDYSKKQHGLVLLGFCKTNLEEHA